MSRKPKYPHLKELYYTDRNAYHKEWRKLNPKYNQVKDEWRKLDKNLFEELPTDVIPVNGFPTYYARPNGEVWRDTRGKESAVKTGKERVLRLTPTYNQHTHYWSFQPYKKDGFMDKDNVYNIFYSYQQNKNCCQNTIDGLNWLMRIEFDKEKMMNKEVSLLDIKSRFCVEWEKRFQDVKSMKREKRQIL